MHYVGNMRLSIYDYLQPYCLITSPSPVDYVTSRWPGFSLSLRVEIFCETATCVAFFDGYPVSPGHALIVPKRHVSSYFDLTDHEREAMNVMLQYVKRVVDERFHPDGYNIGINVWSGSRPECLSLPHASHSTICRRRGEPEGWSQGSYTKETEVLRMVNIEENGAVQSQMSCIWFL